MITFGYHTYKAEIHAWPCLPDTFEIFVSKATFINAGQFLRIPHFEGWVYRIYESMSKLGHIILYTRDYPEEKPNTRAQDILLERYGNNWTYRNTTPHHHPKRKPL